MASRTCCHGDARLSHHLCNAVHLAPDDNSLDLALGPAQRLNQGAHLQSGCKNNGDLRMADDVLHRVWPKSVVERHTVGGLPIAGLR